MQAPLIEIPAHPEPVASVPQITAPPLARGGSLWLRGGNAALVSLSLHLCVTLACAAAALTPSGATVSHLIYSPPPVEEMTPLESVNVQIQRPQVEEQQTKLFDVAVAHNTDPASSLRAPWEVINWREETRVADLATRAVAGGDGSGLGDGGDGAAESGEGQAGAEFFGVQAAGKRFVFVVDSSRSMTGRKWIACCRELLAAIERLKPSQSFYVIFFDHDTHPMFQQKRPQKDLLPATEENTKKLRRWLNSIDFGTETRPFHSMRLALRLNADAIFLLSDGEFVDPTRDFLLSENGRFNAETGERDVDTIVHTIGFHSRACVASLQPIANENGGVFQFVPNPRDKAFRRRR